MCEKENKEKRPTMIIVACWHGLMHMVFDEEMIEA
jgi:hypothetical protein